MPAIVWRSLNLSFDYERGNVFITIAHLGRNTHCKSIGNSQPAVEVKENWHSNVLLFTWNPDYFKQFFKPGAHIAIQVTVNISETSEEQAVFIPYVIGIIRAVNAGYAKLSISNENKDKISDFSHYYVLKPVATQSDVYLSSRVIKSSRGDQAVRTNVLEERKLEF